MTTRTLYVVRGVNDSGLHWSAAADLNDAVTHWKKLARTKDITNTVIVKVEGTKKQIGEVAVNDMLDLRTPKGATATVLKHGGEKVEKIDSLCGIV